MCLRHKLYLWIIPCGVPSIYDTSIKDQHKTLLPLILFHQICLYLAANSRLLKVFRGGDLIGCRRTTLPHNVFTQSLNFPLICSFSNSHTLSPIKPGTAKANTCVLWDTWKQATCLFSSCWWFCITRQSNRLGGKRYQPSSSYMSSQIHLIG